MFGPNFFVYIAGQGKRDDAKVPAFAAVVKLSLYDAKVMLGAPGPRKVGAFVKEEEAQMLALKLRQAGFVAFVVDKARFSRAPKVFRARKAVEDPQGLAFTIEMEPQAGSTVLERTFELPQPKGLVRALVLGYYTQTTTHSAGTRSRMRSPSSSLSHVREPFIHLYSEDPHTILEVCGTKFELAWLKEMETLAGELRWQRLAERFAAFYAAKLDTTLFRVPEEVNTITAALNVDVSQGQAGQGLASSSSSKDDAPVAMAASRLIVYSLVFGV